MENIRRKIGMGLVGLLSFGPLNHSLSAQPEVERTEFFEDLLEDEIADGKASNKENYETQYNELLQTVSKSISPEDSTDKKLDEFYKGLRELGYEEGMDWDRTVGLSWKTEPEYITESLDNKLDSTLLYIA